jgi:hypothetical protein
VLRCRKRSRSGWANRTAHINKGGRLLRSQPGRATGPVRTESEAGCWGAAPAILRAAWRTVRPLGGQRAKPRWATTRRRIAGGRMSNASESPRHPRSRGGINRYNKHTSHSRPVPASTRLERDRNGTRNGYPEGYSSIEEITMCSPDTGRRSQYLLFCARCTLCERRPKSLALGRRSA